MDGKEAVKKKKNPREGANCLSALTFSWVLKTFWVGYRRDLEITDLPEPLKEHTSSLIGDKLASVWNDELNKTKNKRPSLLRALIKIFGARMAIYGIIMATLEMIPMVLQPIALARLLNYFSSDDTSIEEAYFYAAMVVLCSALNVFITHPGLLAFMHTGMKIRVSCCSLIYRKSLKLSKTALGETTVGQVVNLLSNDVNRFDVAMAFLHDLWVGPLKTIIITYLMFQEVGAASIVGVASLVLFIPVQGFFGKRSSTLRLRTAIRTDERVRLTNEIINGIQAIKMYTWEYPFSDLIQKARRREVRVIRQSGYIQGILMSFMMFSARLSLFITILVYVLSGGELTAGRVFMLTAYYNVLRDTMTIFLPHAITHVAQVSVSIKRLQEFLLYDEVNPQNYKNTENHGPILKTNGINIETNGTVKKEDLELQNSTASNNDASVSLENVYAKWLEDDDQDTLKGINMHVKPGQLVAVVGQVGSGKTSLLNVILRELPISRGSMNIPNKISYASQEPWLFAGSVRQNILFGRKFDQKRYEHVIKVCQLKRDFTLWPYGDKTIVGERGISLSGGQRARINLARAVYADASLYLLDDPLSAVDAHVGKHMFEECIEKYLKGRTRILVTHQIQFLRNVEKIFVMRDGRVEAEGTYNKLVEMGIDFGSLLESASIDVPHSSASLPPSRSVSRRPSITMSMNSFVSTETVGKNLDDPEELAETRTRGTLSRHVWSAYCKAAGNCCSIFILICLFVCAQLCASGSDYFIAFWVNLERRYSNSTIKHTPVPNSTMIPDHLEEMPISRNYCIYIFTGLMAATIIITFIRSFTFFNMCMQASKRLHDTMFRKFSRATMRFFNNNPVGRILNRFSKDMGAIDELLPTALADCLEIGLTLLGILVIVGIVNPWLLLPAIFIGIIFYVLRVFYITTSQSVKRLEGITRSPVFNHLSATLQGLATIRSCHAEQILTHEFDRHQDLHSSAWYTFIGSSRAFAFWLDIFCLIYICLVTMSFLVLSDYDIISSEGGDVGLAITQTIGLTGMLQWGMRQSAELENQMTSVERILEYTNIESEPPLESLPEKKPKKDWPTEGKIEFKNVYLTYAPLEPPVLKNLNFTIEPRERVGIVGRTGAGKSSIIAALFRLADLEGIIEIDGVDTGEIGLHDFRSKISIIPQEPFLFSGSLRKNLDPFEQYGDNVLWSALEDVELKEMGLELHIGEGGSNLSVGQRQLVCLARAIVRNNKILVLDEATANVDLRTDELIQKAIRRKFADCTVLTIAHRLNTVMDSDRILVMDSGTVVEFDHPHVLLQNKDSGFLASLIQETGKTMSDALTTVARENYESRQQSQRTKLE